MKYEIKIRDGEATLTLPREKLLEVMGDCTEAELKTLIAVCACPDDALTLSGLEEGEFNSALSFWRGAKLIGRQSAKKKSITDTVAKQPQEPSAAKTTADNANVPTAADVTFDGKLPEYTSDEIKRITSKDRILRSILDEAQQVFGKVFNTVEMNYLIAMRDHLGLDGEYILMLLHYFRAEGKPMCYVVKVADDLVKKGISDAEALDGYLRWRTAFRGIEGRYRELFGIGSRKLTSYEEKYFQSWTHDMKMPFELVQLAFDRTVEKKGTPQKSYINGILKKWQQLSLYSVDDVLKHEENEKAAKSASGQTTGKAGASGMQSFDVNEFFNAALERSYGEKKE